MPEFKTARIDLLTPDMPVALGHTGWVEEIWANLISNALKYGGQPAHIQIRGYALDDGQVCFEVQDNGQGISPEKMHLLFKQFERLDTERGIGHGLGLSIVASIIAKLVGTVSAESQVGQGSIFRLTLRAG
jgi:two-component system sensor histidine kinase/response regulator